VKRRKAKPPVQFDLGQFMGWDKAKVARFKKNAKRHGITMKLVNSAGNELMGLMATLPNRGGKAI